MVSSVVLFPSAGEKKKKKECTQLKKWAKAFQITSGSRALMKKMGEGLMRLVGKSIRINNNYNGASNLIYKNLLCLVSFV